MFLRSTIRRKDGKEHRYWSVVENKRVSGGGAYVQVVIALVVTPDGLPLAYEVMSGNTSDKTTLGAFLARIERQYGKAQRTWLMDRGIPTERCWPRCGPPTRRFNIWSARRRSG